MKRTLSVFLSLIGAAAFGDIAVADVGLGEGSVCAPVATLFSKPALGDYSPRAGSPSAKVVPVGSETDMPAVDLLGKPRASGGAYDLGAYQHQASGLMILFK